MVGTSENWLESCVLDTLWGGAAAPADTRRYGQIALQVVDSDESEEPSADGKPDAYQGRHRGADRFRQVTSAGGVLAAIVLLLAGGGTVLFWMSGIGDAEPLVLADGVGDLCDSVIDEELLTPWADAEVSRESSNESQDEVRSFSCAYTAEYAGDEAYRLVTLLATVQVYEETSDARASYAGVLEFEASEGHETSSVGGVAEQAASALLGGEEEVEVRLHAQEANATLSLNGFFTGAPPEGGDREQLTADLAAGLIDALPREGN